MTENARSFRYRYDLDGLRGIAIALVVFYHVFVGRVSGGVDVFLLLSGYFFLGSQLRYADKPDATFNPWWPIWRTLRRLVPALALTVGATYLLIQFLTPQLMRTEFTQQITASLLYYQNWELARQNADYAAASAATSPLQHLWSMSVQGQFYLAAILGSLLLGWLIHRVARAKHLNVHRVAGPLLILITLVSFAYASRYGLFAPPANYYDTFSRTWELTLGGVLAVYSHQWSIPQRLADFFTGFGLLALALTGVLIADTTAYPGPLSLLPLGGAALIIVGGGGKLSAALASRPVRWLGDIAYPLYLWHWPLLIIATSHLNQNTPSRWLGLAIILSSVILADLTHRFVERPLRQHRKRPLRTDMPVNRARADLRTCTGAARAGGGVLVAAATVALLSVHPAWMANVRAGEQTVLDPTSYPGVMAHFNQEVPTGLPVQPDPILVGGIFPPTSTSHCFVGQDAEPTHYNTTRVDGTPCIFGNPNADFNVFVVGGSHAEQWMSGLDKLGREMNFRIVPIMRQGCPIELGDDLTVTPECATWGAGVVEQIIDAQADLVISTTTRPQSFFGHGPDVVPAGYLEFWKELDKHNIPFLGLRDNPWGFDDEGIAREFDECYVALEDPVECGMRREQVYAPVDPGAIALAEFDNMIAVDTADWFCEEDICPVVIGNTAVYRDMHHISNAFADSAMPLLREYLKPFLAREPQKQRVPAAAQPTAPASAQATVERKGAPASSTPTSQEPTPLPVDYSAKPV
ncbi:acyltransferase [Corynebacterium lizhenjunii]|uniref:Acyltransferase n=1 Tax=Corynebacterium lizhenjunii TaxID=2709394 RepID=A0A7T0P9Y7_9CORY|nr:acyltransferase family protein [Corynebacterium lizhenjunii]QPK78436.1 acyltransferase [Corynebacterium lizhenjunii]